MNAVHRSHVTLRRMLVAAIVVCTPVGRAISDGLPYDQWLTLKKRAGAALGFGRPIAERRAVVADLLADGQSRSFEVFQAGLRAACAESEQLQQRRADAWTSLVPRWSRPRALHYRETVSMLLRQFQELADADIAAREDDRFLDETADQVAAAPEAAWRPIVVAAGGAESRRLPVRFRIVGARMATRHASNPDVASSLRALVERDVDARVRLAALDGLGLEGEPGRTLGLGRIADPDWVVRATAIRRIPESGRALAIPRLVTMLSAARPDEREIVAEALRRLTGRPFEADADLWARWWKDAQRDPNAGPPVGPAVPPAPVVTIYGLPVHSDRVLFVLDTSGSMGEPSGPSVVGVTTPSKLDVAKRELWAALRTLPPRGVFGVVAFDGRMRAWRTEPVDATDAAKAEAKEWIDSLDATWNTCLGGALRLAFRMARLAPVEAAETPFDTLVVVSDGLPTYYAYGAARSQSPGEILDLVRAWNDHKRLRIHTIAIGDDASRPFLRRLAEDNGGVAAVRGRP